MKKKVLLVVSVTFLICLVGIIHFITQPIPPYIQNQLKIKINSVLQEKGAILNVFKIKSSPYDFYIKNSNDLQLEVAYKNFLLKLEGKIKIDWRTEKKIIKVKYGPKIELFYNKKVIPQIKKEGLDFKISLSLFKSNFDLSKAHIQLSLKPFIVKSKDFLYKFNDFSSDIQLDPNRIKIKTNLPHIYMSDTLEEHILDLKGFSTNIDAQFQNSWEFLDQFKINHNLNLSQVEMLWGDFYLSRDLSDIKLKNYFELKKKNFSSNTHLEVNNLNLYLKTKIKDWQRFLKKADTHSVSYDISLKPSKVQDLVGLVKSFFPDLKTEKYFEDVWGDIHLKANISDNQLSNGVFRLENLGVFSQKNKLYLENLNLNMPLNQKKESEVQIQFDNFRWRNLNLKLSQTPIKLNYKNNFKDLKLEIKDLNTFNVNNFDFSISHLKFYKKQHRFNIYTQLMLNETKLTQIMKSACIYSKKEVPVNFQSDLLKINASNENVDIKGHLRASLFGGEIRLKDLKIFKWLSAIPETQLNLVWDKIQLKSLGKFLNFGKMEGVFQGYFKDVVFQKTLPTQFNFKAHLVPEKGEEIIFSTKAMKNFVNMVTTSDIEKTMPSYLSWFAFSWPSDLLGGYNINYAGISMYALNGSIMLETLDPSEIYLKEKKHYILYGRRFRVPVVSKNYPVVLDAFGVTHFLRHTQAQFEALQKNQINSENVGKTDIQSKENTNNDDPQNRKAGENDQSTCFNVDISKFKNKTFND